VAPNPILATLCIKGLKCSERRETAKSVALDRVSRYVLVKGVLFRGCVGYREGVCPSDENVKSIRLSLCGNGAFWYIFVHFGFQEEKAKY